MKPFKLILCLLLIVVLGSCASDDENSIGLGYSDIYNLPEIPYNYSKACKLFNNPKSKILIFQIS